MLRHLHPSGVGSFNTIRANMKSATTAGSRDIHKKKNRASEPTKYRSRGACDVSASTTASTTW